MIASERRNTILQTIQAKGSVRAADIAKAIGVTTETIRKDLIYLHEQGLVKKEFGGAVATPELNLQPIQLRASENSEEKRKIALKALDYMAGNSIFFLDAGSAVSYFAQALRPNPDIAIITNSFIIVDHILGVTKNVHFIGGEISEITMSTGGFWADAAIASLKIDVAFLGSNGFHSHSGPGTKSFADAQFKSKVIEKSSRRIVLADHTKFTAESIVQYASWSEIDLLITDDGVTQEQADELRRHVEVVIA